MGEFENGADWATEGFRQNGRGKSIVIFYPRPVLQKKETEVSGHPVYKEKMFLKIVMPGEQKLVHDQPMRESDKERFPQEWAHYQNTKTNLQPGVPIDHWHSISLTQKAELKHLNIMTVEHLAGLSDAGVQQIMGGHDLRRKAQLFVETGKDSEMLAKIKADAEKKEEALRAELAELRKLVENFTSPAKEKVSA